MNFPTKKTFNYFFLSTMQEKVNKIINHLRIKVPVKNSNRDIYNDDIIATVRDTKSLRKFRPTSEQATYTSGDKLVFQLPKSIIWNGGQAYIRFQLTGTLGATATYVCIQQGVHSIFSEVRVRYGSDEIIYIRKFNAIKTIENLINRRYEIYEGNFLL